MSRLIDQDFTRLVDFTKSYKVEDIFHSKSRTQLIRRAHKHCLAAIQSFATIESLSSNGVIQLKGLNLSKNDFCYDSLAESFSDISSSFYAALHGLNKPAHMSLRSAIETGIRALAGISSEEAKTTTSVFKLLEIAKNCIPFQDQGQQHFDILKTEYGKLCSHTHSATVSHMVKNHAMSNFPKLETEKLREWVNSYERSVTSILSILVLSNRQIYLAAKPKGQDVYDEVLPTKVRLFALGAV